MAFSVHPITYVITIPQSDLTYVDVGLYTHDTDAFRLELKAWEDNEGGIIHPKTHLHNTEVTIVGVTYIRAIQILSPYSITYEDGQYTVILQGSNNNIFDVQGGILNRNQVQVIPTNAAGYIVVPVGSGLDSTQDAKLMGLPELPTIEASTVIAKEAKQDEIISTLDRRSPRWFSIPHDPRTLNGYYDFFFGKNGEQLNDSLWDNDAVVNGEPSNDFFFEIENNKAIAQIDITDATEKTADILFRYPPNEDFTITYDFNFDGSDPTGEPDIAFGLEAAGGELVWIDCYLYGGTWWFDIVSETQWEDDSGPDLIYNKIKIQRIGGEVKVWWWHIANERWEWKGDTAGYTIAEDYSGVTAWAEAYFWIYADGTGICKTTVDNFICQIPVTDIPNTSFIPAWKDGDFILDNITGEKYFLDGDTWEEFGSLSDEEEDQLFSVAESVWTHSEAQTLLLQADDIQISVEFIKQMQGGRWRILNDQMIFYEDDNLTEIARFNLTYDGSQNPIERQRV